MADVTLPQLGETVTEGTITRWFKKVGDTVSADEPLFEVSTDKVDTEVPSPITGTVTEIRVQEGDTVPVGAVIAVVGEAEGAPAAAPEPEPAAAEPAAAERRGRAGGRAGAPGIASQGTGRRRCRSRRRGRRTCRRASGSRCTPARATRCTRAGRGGTGGSTSRCTVGQSSAVTGRAPPRRRAQHQRRSRQGHRSWWANHARRRSRLHRPGRFPTAPASRARRPQLHPHHPHPLRLPRQPHPPPAPHVTPGERDSTVKLSKIRKLTGSHMVMSKGVSPHAFSVVEVDFANVDVTRNKVKSEWKAAEGFGLTYLPFITRAVVEALTEFPHLNASVSDDDLVVHNFIDIGIAVDLDFQGLLVPVVRAAETKRLRAIAQEINDLAGRARSRKLSPDEISGGTFTISNNGSAGSVLTMPIINQPQVAILSTDAIVRKPVVVHTADGGEGIAIHPVGNLAMSWDHRAFDGAYAAGFLVKIKETLETRDWAAEL